MGIWGQRIDGVRWMERINKRKAELVEALLTLDRFFIPIVGSKSEAIDEKRLNELESKWRGFDIASQEERDACSAYKAVSTKKDAMLRAELKAKYEAIEQQRRDLKAAARTTYSELSKKRTKAKEKIGKCQGEAFINYNSGKQLLAAFASMHGYKTIKKTDKDTLLNFFDRPAIPALLSLNKLKKEIGTYGESWTKQWTTKPCKEEGWLHPGDGRLHCKYNQLEAETGRSSSSKPNAQNLPKDDDVRSCFICDPPNENIRISVCCDAETTKTEVRTGIMLEVRAEYFTCTACGKPCDTKAEEYVIVTVDMAGAELRIIAELANAGSWITAFSKGHDVHSVGTEILYPVEWPAEQVKSLLKPGGWSPEDSNSKTGEKVPCFNDDGTPLMKKNKKGVMEHLHVPPCAYFAIKPDGELARQKCECPKHKKRRDGNKATNFLLAYGGGPSALADAIGCTTEEAKKLMVLHESKFPDIWGYLKRSGEQARFKKEARDMFGRRRLFPDPTWEGAKEFFIQEHDDRLELEDVEAEAQILAFKMRQLRPPTDEEEYMLTHRDPSTKEIASAYKGMYGSIERRGKNMCIQGTNASIIKRAMGCGFDKNGKGYLWHLLPALKAKILSMVHDELVVQCPKRFGKQVFLTVGDAFTRAGAEVMHKVVMEYDGNIGPCWSK
jgi:DNA polymerase I-like protein with 3'-5' exonuclease and polymerase domains